MKVIIIGRGPSCLRCNKGFVESHDLVVTVNRFVYQGYEAKVGDKTDIQFRNGSCEAYTLKEIASLGLKKIIYTNIRGGKPLKNGQYKNVEIIDPIPPIKYQVSKWGFGPSSGTMAFFYMLKNYNVELMSLVGFDLFEVGKRPYYFNKMEADRRVRKLWDKGVYKNNVINKQSGHDSKKTVNFMCDMFRLYSDVEFCLLTDSALLRNTELPNVKIL